jgi:long-chain fatty acid transport protein
MNLVRTVFKLTPWPPCAWAPCPPAATNGMLMEGYGPVATGMGGAAQAVDHGTAAMAQNPATLALMAPTSRHDAAFGILGPRVASSMAGMGSAESSGKSYVMPAFGYARRSGNLTYGFGLFAQGGMGTEYGADSFLAMGSGQGVRSELGVGSLLFPLAWQVTPALALGMTVDLMWSGLDMRMAASGAQLGGLVTGASGNLAAALPALGGAPWARMDFSNNSDFTGAARSTGWGAKLGLVYKAMPGVVLGASYRMKSSLKDMKTAPTRPASAPAGGFADSGRITVDRLPVAGHDLAGRRLAGHAGPAGGCRRQAHRLGRRDEGLQAALRQRRHGRLGELCAAAAVEGPDRHQPGVAYGLGAAHAARRHQPCRQPHPRRLVNPLFPATVKSTTRWAPAGASRPPVSSTLR